VTPAIRRGGADDARAAADLYLRARAAALRAGSIPAGVHDDDDVRGHFAAHVVEECELWLAEEDGILAGILVLDADMVDHLYVEPGRTGRRIGSALLAVAKRERPEGLRLWTFQSNAGAQRFYERHGFVAVRRTDGHGNEERAPDVLYACGGAQAPS
jgi:GNAT superfamily N-acetyltransferase